jgi:hypothetical protein
VEAFRAHKKNLGPKITLIVSYIHEEIKNIPNRVEKAKISLQSPKTELRPQNIKNKFPHYKEKNK